jgi:hypothetical protein
MSVQSGRAPFDNQGLDTSFALIDRWAPFESRFTAEHANGHPSRAPAFVLGGTVGTIWIKNLMVEEM